MLTSGSGGAAPQTNELLTSLPVEEYQRVSPSLRTIMLSLGQVLYQPGDFIEHLYFPIDCVVSLLCLTEDGLTAEAGLTGCEGVVGVSSFLGNGRSRCQAVTQIAGRAFRISAPALRKEFERATQFQRKLLYYADTLLAQVSQTAACNRLHSVEKRLCRWLLLCHDRVPSDELVMTQEFIANMLGGRRESVTIAAGHLQESGLIHYARGRIRILDPEGLEAQVCECYRAVAGPARNGRQRRAAL